MSFYFIYFDIYEYQIILIVVQCISSPQERSKITLENHEFVIVKYLFKDLKILGLNILY